MVGSWLCPQMLANALAYYDTATIIAVKSFIVQAPGYLRLDEVI